MRDTCPDCREPLIVYEMEGVEIDRCLTCLGTWLDAGELAMLTGLAGVEPGAMTRSLENAKNGPRARRRCPRCGRKLRIIHVGDDPPVELDRCPRGHGLWLDAGEMEAVIRSHAVGEEGSVARFFTDLYRSELDRDGTE